VPGRITQSGGVSSQDERDYAERCASRAANGYDSGMGQIFRRIAGIAPLGPRQRWQPVQDPYLS
jgi:hypothetical protein